MVHWRALRAARVGAGAHAPASLLCLQPNQPNITRRRPWWMQFPSTCPATARGSAAAPLPCSRCRRVRLGGPGGYEGLAGRRLALAPAQRAARQLAELPAAAAAPPPLALPFSRLLQRRGVPQVLVVPAARAAVGRGGAGRPRRAQGRARPGRRAGAGRRSGGGGGAATGAVALWRRHSAAGQRSGCAAGRGSTDRVECPAPHAPPAWRRWRRRCASARSACTKSTVP